MLGKIIRLIRVETTTHDSQKNYERNRFSGKAPPSRYIGLRTPKKIPRVANTSLGIIFRLVLVEKVPLGPKNIMNDIAFPEKPLQADISCSRFEKKILESQILR